MATMHGKCTVVFPRWAPYLFAFLAVTRLAHVDFIRDRAAKFIVNCSDLKFTAGDDA